VTAIEWTDETWNPTDGCKVCSPGCANCYAMRFAGRFSKPGERYHGLVSIGKNKRAIWTGESRLDAGKLAKPLSWRKPRRIFVNSMSDLFYEGFSNEQIAAVFGVMAACPQHTFQILTKRAKRMCEWFEWVQQESEHPLSTCGREWISAMDVPVASKSRAGQAVIGPGAVWPLPNVWLGVSVENQDAADERIPRLLDTPAALRFLSVEPLIGPVDLENVCHRTGTGSSETGSCLEGNDGFGLSAAREKIDWVIAGCESGPGARPCATAWLTDLQRQCADAGTTFFLKQATQGTWVAGSEHRVMKYDPDAFVTAGAGSKIKAGGVIGLPYLDGVQYAALPLPRTPK
jgi:protein gp37